MFLNRDAATLVDGMKHTIFTTATLYHTLAVGLEICVILSDTATVFEIVTGSNRAVIVTDIILIVICSSKDAVLSQSLSSGKNAVSLTLLDARTFANWVKNSALFTLFRPAYTLIFSGTLADALVIGISPWLCITRCLVNWVIFSHCNAVCTKSLCLKKESCAFLLRYAAAHGQRMQNIFTTSVIHNLLALLALR